MIVEAAAMTTKSPIGKGLWGRAASCTARVCRTPQRGRTTSAVATTMGGSGDSDANIKAPAMRAMHC